MLGLLLMPVALAAPLTTSTYQDGTLVGATKTPTLHAWEVGPDHLSAARALPVSGPRLSSLCLSGTTLRATTDHAATIETRALDSGALLGTLAPEGARLTGLTCLPDGGFAALLSPRVPNPDPDAARLGPAAVLWHTAGGEDLQLPLPSGAVALAPAAEGGLWILDSAGQVRRWSRSGTSAPTTVPLAGEPRALVVAPDGALWASSSESLCRVGGPCIAVDGGGGTLLAGVGWVAVGGYAEVRLLDAASLALRGTVTGRAVGLHALADEDELLVVLGREVVWLRAGGQVRSRAALAL